MSFEAKYDSCHLLEHGLSFECHFAENNKRVERLAIKNCCLSKTRNGSDPVLVKDFNVEEGIDWKQVFDIKRELRNQQKISRIPECEGCYISKCQNWDGQDYVSYINFNHWQACNSRCIYCYTNGLRGLCSYNIYNSMVDLINKDLFRNTGEITFQGGEPTLLDEFDDLVNLFLEQKANIRVHSSGIKYSEAIVKGLQEGLLTVVISIDSGDENVYKSIKRVSSYNNVVENIKKYSLALEDSQKHLLKVKYIIVPGYNDTLKNIDDWFEVVIKNQVKYVIYDVEFTYQNTHPEGSDYIYMLMDYIEYKAERLNLNWERYDSAKYLSSERKIPARKFLINFKPLYNILFNIYKSLDRGK